MMLKKRLFGLSNCVAVLTLFIWSSQYCILKAALLDLSKYKGLKQSINKLNVGSKIEEDISVYPNLKRLSRGKKTEASSVRESAGVTYLPEYAVDGSYGTLSMGFKNCFHSNEEKNPWLLIDLGVTSTVVAVLITNRSDYDDKKYFEQLKKYNIFVTKQKYSSFESIPIENRCGRQFDESLGSGAANVVDCKGKVGRYVYIYTNDDNGILQLCEVEVFGVEGDICSNAKKGTYKCGENSPSLLNLSRKKKTKASSQLIDHSADLANDGDFHPILADNKYCFQSYIENYPWWMVDLNATSTIFAVLVVNRLDTENKGEKELLHKYNIMISDEEVDHPKNIPIENRCGNEFLSSVPNEFNFVDCHGKIGRYVYIYTNDVDSTMPLCEVEVFGDTKIYCSKGYDLFENKCVKKSSNHRHISIQITA